MPFPENPIRFLNHASFLVSTAKSSLLIDPYLFGPAFNNGWDLVWRDVAYEGIDEVTHIWFSHEHPDHFSPPFLNSIPAGRREKITVLYQETRDKRVVSFCRSLGFTVIELANQTAYEIDSTLNVLCGQVPPYDSWLDINIDGLKVLNLNDCILDTRDKLLKVAGVVGHTSILFSQFSYANWLSNPDEPQTRQRFATGMLERLRLQCEVLQPKIIVPFASFVFFSNVENIYMNDSVNQPKEICNFLQKNTKSLPVFLIPNQTWDGEKVSDNEANIRAWMGRFSTAHSRPLREPLPVSEEEVKRACSFFMRRMRDRNSRSLIWLLSRVGIIPEITFFVWDLEKAYRFSYLRGLVDEPRRDAHAVDISLGSDSLVFLFTADFGADTLYVNGRFHASVAGRARFLRAFAVPILNNMGRFVDASIVKTFMEPGFIRQGLRTIGILS